MDSSWSNQNANRVCVCGRGEREWVLEILENWSKIYEDA